MEAAQVTATRFEPEIFVPPRPGQPVRRAHGKERDQALFFDRMERRFPVGLSRNGEPLYANFEFIDGQRGAHVNISGVSGVATKTSYATFLLHSLFTSGVLGRGRGQHQGPDLQREGRGPPSSRPTPTPASTRTPSVATGRWDCPPSRSARSASSPRPGPGPIGRWPM